MKRWAIVLTVLVIAIVGGVSIGARSRPEPSQFSVTQPHLQMRQLAIRSRLQQLSDSKVLFLGDSIVELSAIDIAHPEILNGGIAGAKIADVESTLAYLMADPEAWSNVSCVMVYIGTNNAYFADLEDRAVLTRQFADSVKRLSEAVADRTIVLLSVASGPDGSGIDRELLAIQNEELKQASRARYFNLGDRFTEAAGAQPLDRLFPDKIHFSSDGYKIWAPLAAEASSLCD